MSDNIENISKRVGGFLGEVTVPVIKTTSFCVSMICNSVSNIWKGFSNEIAPEVENFKKATFGQNVEKCVDAELEDLSESDENTL